MLLENIDKLGASIQSMLGLARVPGAAIAVVMGKEILFARGYGCRNLEANLPMSFNTVYPIASTTKPLNATLLGILADEDKIAWDAPVRDYLPRFRLADSAISAQVTVRDLVTMRTGLPRHDLVWSGTTISRAELVERLRYLELSAEFRERFQYNNLTTIAAGHIAEVVTGRSWEELVQQKLLDPLGMSSTGFELPAADDVTQSYHENSRRELKLTGRVPTEVGAPAGGAIHSTVADMARWLSFNLGEANVAGRPLLKSKTLAEIHSPQVIVGADPSAPTPGAAYAMGWFVDTYNGHARLLHGGYIHDVNSDVMIFPKIGIGVVSFINFGPPGLARVINQQAFDSLMGLKTAQTVEEKLAQYEMRIEDTRRRNASVRRAMDTSPSHSLCDYVGRYVHPGYGSLEIQQSDGDLVLHFHQLVLPLEHWHYDAWIAKECELFFIHTPHPFDAVSRLLFATDADGEIATLSIQLEPSVSPIRFSKVAGKSACA